MEYLSIISLEVFEIGTFVESTMFFHDCVLRKMHRFYINPNIHQWTCTITREMKNDRRCGMYSGNFLLWQNDRPGLHGNWFVDGRGLFLIRAPIWGPKLMYKWPNNFEDEHC